MAVLLGYHDDFAAHDSGPAHPESPARLGAALAGAREVSELVETIQFVPRAAERLELERVHTPAHLDALAALSARGGGQLDPDTHVGARSFSAACRAAGAGLDALARLDAGEASAAFLVLRPPGHHATSTRAMGFCLLNNVAITAAALAERGERVLIVDYDAHHGNGTQEIFYGSSEVFYVSLHQAGAFPGTGHLDELGVGAGLGTTLNVPFAQKTAGDAYRLAIDELIVPSSETFSPTWLLISAGFDAHRADPLTDLSLSAGDFADLTVRLSALVAPGRRIAFLEGGYDLHAVQASSAACIAALGGVIYRPEPATSDEYDLRGRAGQVVATARALRPDLS